MKKGFTLMELLAVIVILAVIALITVPLITDLINNSRDEAFEITAKNILDAAKKYIISHTYDASPLEETSFVIENNSFVGNELPMTGQLPDSGEIKIKSDSTIQMAVNNNNLCALKGPFNDELMITSNVSDCDLIDVTPESCFVFNSTTKTITDYLYTDPLCPSDVVIPKTINNIPVLSLGYRSFYNNNLTSVIIPDTVITLEGQAFRYNTIQNVVIGNGVTTIGPASFYENLLVSVNIPDSVTIIDNYAFAYNKLTNITIPVSVTSIGIAAFNGNLLPDNQAFIYARNTDGTEDTSNIVSYGGAKKDNIVIPNSVTTIGGDAFSSADITSITIPTSVTSIGIAAFNDNLLPDNQSFIYARNPDGTEDTSMIVSYGGAKKDNVVIPTGVITIKNSTFYYCGLTGTITIPDTVTTIETWAFGFNQLTGAILPSNLTRIEDYTFEENRLTSINIPSTVTYIGAHAFCGNNLSSVLIPNGVTTIGEYGFRYNSITQGDAKIDNTSGSVTIGSYAFDNNGASQATTITPTYLR